MDKLMGKATFSEIYKLLKDDKSSKVYECFSNLFGIGLLFFPGLMCKEAAALADIGNGVNLLGAKEGLENAVKNIAATFKAQKYTDFTTRYEHMQIAQTLLVYAAYFDSMKLYLPNEAGEIALSDMEKYTLTQEGIEAYVKSLQAKASGTAAGVLKQECALPDPVLGFDAYLRTLGDFYSVLNREFIKFYEKLSFWEQLEEHKREHFAAVIRYLPEKAVENYQKQYFELSACFPDFAIWARDREHFAIEHRIDVGFEQMKELMDTYAERSAQRKVVDAFEKYRKKYELYIEAPVIGTDEMEYDFIEDVVFPAKKDVFIPQKFRARNYEKNMRIEPEETWQDADEQSNIGQFISSILRHPAGSLSPIIILGHPGAGKTLLCNMLAARILCHEYHIIIIRLRDTDAGETIMEQINQQIERDLGNICSWEDIVGAKLSKPILFIFDGYDELLQASGQVHADYLKRIAEFQREQGHIHGMVIRCMITSRISLIEKAFIPQDSRIIRLCDFDPARIRTWCRIWNEANEEYFKNHSLQPFLIDEESKVYELAGQPLLLLMLALYDSGNNALEKQRDINTTQLYDNIIREFISREKRKDREFQSCLQQEALVDAEMDKLGVAALGMYNRKVLYIRSPELEEDMGFFGVNSPKGMRETTNGLMESEAVLGRFFFIYKSGAVETQERKVIRNAAYEFLHNTFGEFLTANAMVREVYKVIKRILLFKDNGMEIGWKDTLKKQWYACFIYAPLFSRPEVVKMLGEWSESYLNAQGIGGDQIKEAMDLLIETEIRNILIGAAMARICGVAEEKGNPFAQKALMEHLAIYSMNILILGTMLCGKRYILETDKFAECDAWNKLLCIWRYAFSEEDLLSFSNLFWVHKEETCCWISYAGGPFYSVASLYDTSTCKKRLRNLYVIHSSLGDTVVRSAMATLLGEGISYQLDIQIIKDEKLGLESQYTWNAFLRKMSYQGKLGKAELDRLFESGEVSRREMDPVSLYRYYLLLGSLLQEEDLDANNKETEKLLKDELIAGLKILKEYGSEACQNGMLLGRTLRLIVDMADKIELDQEFYGQLIGLYSGRSYLKCNKTDVENFRAVMRGYVKFLKSKKNCRSFRKFIRRNAEYLIEVFQGFVWGSDIDERNKIGCLCEILELGCELTDNGEGLAGSKVLRAMLKPFTGDFLKCDVEAGKLPEFPGLTIREKSLLINSAAFLYRNGEMGELRAVWLCQKAVGDAAISKLLGYSWNTAACLLYLMRCNILKRDIKKYTEELKMVLRANGDTLPVSLIKEIGEIGKQYGASELESKAKALLGQT